MWIRTVGIVLGLAVATAASAADLEGKQIYEARCVFCHGQAGHGDGPAGKVLKPPPKSFAEPGYWDGADKARLEDIVRHGKPGTAMVPFGQTLSETQIEEVLAYLRTFAKPK